MLSGKEQEKINSQHGVIIKTTLKMAPYMENYTTGLPLMILAVWRLKVGMCPQLLNGLFYPIFWEEILRKLLSQGIMDLEKK
jgi:hypothetical protein